MTGHYNPWIVVLSFVIAAAGSYGALTLSPARRVLDDHRPRHDVAGIVPAAVLLGITIWSMHFTGMAAFSIPGMVTSYSWDMTIVSLLVAMAFTGIGFFAVVLLQDAREAIVLAGIPMAAGILTMHFLGMLAMTGPMELHFDSDLVVASGLIALVASTGALWLTAIAHEPLRRAVAALAMAGAICGMHYTGMAAATFSMPRDGEAHAPSRSASMVYPT